MYVTRTASRDAAPPTNWGLRRAVWVDFPQPARSASDPAHTHRFNVYLRDLLNPYGIGLRDDPPGQSYGEMAEAVIAQAVPPGEEIDLLLLAVAIPDITPGRATATYLSHICPGDPMAFAVCDQGRAAGFTGLRLIRGYAAEQRSRRALLIVVEQSVLPYDPGVAVAVPDGHSAVGLVFGAGDDVLACPRRVSQRAGVAVNEVRTVLAQQLTTGRARVANVGEAIVGAELGDFSDLFEASRPGGVRVAEASRPYTGVWRALAESVSGRLPAGGLLAPIQLAGYDPQLGYLSVAMLGSQPDTSTG